MAVSCGGNHIAAIKTDGSLWTWGDNGRGQLGNGTTENSLIPIKVMDDVVQVSCADSYTAAVKNDGSLWMWGHNAENQLSSLGTQDSFLYPIQIMDNVESVSCGGWCTAAIKHDGTLWMWGSNNRGQLGIGTTDSSFVPVQVLSNVAAVSCNKTYTAVIKTDGSVWGWGHNVYRQLGTGTAESSLIPVQMQFSIENNYIVSWIDPEPAVKPETSDPQESESPEEPETFESDSFPEAYAAYLEEFNEHRSLIDAYTDWYGFRRPIAFVDIYGDSTPEMIYVEAETVTSSDSYLNILTYQNGQVVLLSRKYWDFFAGSGLSYTLYQAEGSKTLYAYTSYFTSTTIYEQICFEEVDGTLSPQNIESMPAQYQIILSNITSAPVAMTCDEAFTFLTEHSSIS